jgi:hypothetical protein
MGQRLPVPAEDIKHLIGGILGRFVLRSFQPVDVPCIPLLKCFQVLNGGVWDMDLPQENGLTGEGLQGMMPIGDAGPAFAAEVCEGQVGSRVKIDPAPIGDGR